MQFNPRSITLMCALHVIPCAACSPAQASSPTELSRVSCVNFETKFSQASQTAGLHIINRCGYVLDFSEARVQFTAAEARSQPWGQNPPGFSWISWESTGNGFHYKKDPAANWIHVALKDGDSLQLDFNADREPRNPELYLNGAHTPSDPVPPEPKPEPQPTPQPDPKPQPGKKEIVAYYETWSAGWAARGEDHSLASLPPYITTVLLSFARPEASYEAGQYSFKGTGLDFSSDFTVIRDAIQMLKKKNPGTKVLLSVGGATYGNWNQANPKSVAALVQDLGADGADIDYEPSAGACSWGTGGQSCPGDQEFIQIIREFRSALPRPYLITTAAWSTGAFGPGAYPASRFSGNLVGANFGLYVNPLKEVGDLFDAIYIMSYDAGGPSSPAGQPTGYDPQLALMPIVSSIKVP
ncbi:MAG: glycoside hydrolase family 18 protein [Pseudobdellovibrionaceae bacterium]|nr:glycoside hydrolase family 18 protein [Pseudobdellovibrionaceae bacterium]